MKGGDVLLLVAYLIAAATIWFAAGLFDEIYRGRKVRK